MADGLKQKAGASIADARAKVEGAVAKGRAQASKSVAQAKERAEKVTTSAKSSAKSASGRARVKADETAQAAKERAQKAATKTAETVERNPLAAVAGGLAIGAIIAALIPRTQREDSIAGDFGRKVRSTAKKAATNARATAKDQLDALGVNADAARDGLRNLAEKLGEAASSAGSAAAETVRKRK